MTINFETNFESGNGMNFQVKDADVVQFQIRPDTNSNAQQWFYFAVCGAAGRRITFELHGTLATNCPSHWVHCRPVISTDGGLTWKRIAEPGRHDFDAGVFTFVHDVKDERELIAYHYPYGASDLEMKMRKWRAVDGVTSQIIGHSVESRPIEMLRVGPVKGAKRGFWITARQHSAETPASFLMEGFIDFLLSEDARAKALREKAAIALVPMINPDGVINGNYRCNAKGVNLNRVWHEADRETSPEIVAVNDAVAAWVKDGHPYDVFIDFHADSTAREHYVFRTAKEFCPRSSPFGDAYFQKNIDFLNLVAGNAPDLLPSKFVSYYDFAGVSYRHMLHEYGVLGMIPEGGYSDVTHGRNAGTYLTPDRHREVGRAFAIALHDFWEL